MGGDLIITGGMPLNGTVHIPAAKNSVLPLLAAALLCNGTVRFLQVPHLADVDTSVELLQGAGCTARWQGSDITVQGVPSTCRLAPEAAARMRASILFCAPLLARLGRVETVLPGGCRIGARPVDLHLSGLAQMGVHCREEGARLILTAPAGLHGADITLGFPSVGATETLLLAAAAAQGETVLRGAAREPEISDLAAFLNRCGGCVQGAGTSTIRVQGRRMLYSCSFAPMADRIVASTLACACAAAGGRVELTGCRPETYAPLLEILAQMGCRVETGPESAVITRLGALHGAGRVFTGVYPALATDAAPLLAAAMLAADSASSIEDVVFERRFGCAEGFAAFGAAVQVQGRTLDIRPVRQLQGACARAADLRGGAALVVAALAALPKPVISTADMPVLHRCWRNLVPKLSGKCRGKAPARKKHLQKSKIDLHSGQKDDTIQLYKCKQIISVRYAQFYDKIRWRTKLWHSCSMKKWTKTLRRSR
mgnify:CR=1 FL=1